MKRSQDPRPAIEIRFDNGFIVLHYWGRRSLVLREDELTAELIHKKLKERAITAFGCCDLEQLNGVVLYNQGLFEHDHLVPFVQQGNVLCQLWQPGDKEGDHVIEVKGLLIAKHQLSVLNTRGIAYNLQDAMWYVERELFVHP